MRVIKRDFSETEVEFDEITRKIKQLCNISNESKFNESNESNISLKIQVDAPALALKVINQIYDGISTSELDEFTAATAATMSLYNSDYGILAGRLIVNNHHKNNPQSFKVTMNLLSDIISKDIIDFLNDKTNEDKINNLLDSKRDYFINYFGFCTLRRSYLLKYKGKSIETPQYMFMRVSLGIHLPEYIKQCKSFNVFDKIKKTYDFLSFNEATHATPTLFNSGTKYPQMSSCYLIGTKDSVDGIYETIKDVALISKWAGGVGIHISNIRAEGSEISKTKVTSQGIMPMLKVYNDTARYINQSSKRNGSFAMYIEVWHADIFTFLDAKKNTPAAEELRARDLFYALWICNLFMERVKSKGVWSLMCPNQCKGLTDKYSKEFEDLYIKYENQGKYIKQVPAIDIWNAIINSQIESGTPYMLYKDHVNEKSNQKNIGMIKSSNLCCEIMEYSDHEETAVCNLASICLPKYIIESEFIKNLRNKDKYKVLVYSKTDCHFCDKVKNLLSFYKIEYQEKVLSQEERLNLYNEYTDDELNIVVNTMPQVFLQKIVNEQIEEQRIGGFTETSEYLYKISKKTFDYYKLGEITQILVENLNLIIDHNYYPTEKSKISNFKHRPIGIGVQGLADVFMMMELPFTSDEAKLLNINIFECIYYNALYKSLQLAKKNGSYMTFQGCPASKGILQFDMWNKKPIFYEESKWNKLKEEIKIHGLRNSLLVAPMPTASTAQIMGNNESFEPYTSNIYTRRVLAGEFIVINVHLSNYLKRVEMYTKDVIDSIVVNRGSVQHLNIDNKYKEIFKTVWEISQKKLLEMSADRGAFICQSQSLNIFIADADPKKINSVHMYGYSLGLKTGSYYIRTKAALNSQNYSLDHSIEVKNKKMNEMNEKECIMCSS